MKKAKKQRILFIAIVFAVSILALIFITINFRDNIVFFYSPSELLNNEIKQKISNQNFRVGGLVKKGSITKINSIESKFTITDNNNEIAVYYYGILPNLFRENQGVVAKGRLVEDIFITKELLVKHDENYVPLEVKNAIKK